MARELLNLAGLEQELSRHGLFPTIVADSVGGFPLTDAAALRIIGSILHDYYTATEKIFETIAGRIDRSTPQGDKWHKELLEQMTLDVPGLRPPVVTLQTAGALDPLRGFRHVFRNIYGFSLSADKTLGLVRALPAIAAGLKADLQGFRNEMRRLHGLPAGRGGA